MQFDVLRIVLIIKVGTEVWEAEGFWDIPPWRIDWEQLATIIATSAKSHLAQLIDPHKRWSVKAEGETIALKGPAAVAMQKRLCGMSIDGPERWSVKPIKEERFGLGGAVHNG